MRGSYWVFIRMRRRDAEQIEIIETIELFEHFIAMYKNLCKKFNVFTE